MPNGLREGKGDRMWTWREALMIGTLRSLEARMTNSDPTGTCKNVVEKWLADIRLVIKDAEMPDLTTPVPGGRG